MGTAFQLLASQCEKTTLEWQSFDVNESHLRLIDGINQLLIIEVSNGSIDDSMTGSVDQRVARRPHVALPRRLPMD